MGTPPQGGWQSECHRLGHRREPDSGQGGVKERGQDKMAHPMGAEQDRMALLRGEGTQSSRTAAADREPPIGRATQAKQRRGRHVPVQLPHAQRQDPLQGTRQAAHARLQQMHVDEHA